MYRGGADWLTLVKVFVKKIFGNFGWSPVDQAVAVRCCKRIMVQAGFLLIMCRFLCSSFFSNT